MADKIVVETYTEIMDPLEQDRFRKNYQTRYNETKHSVRVKQRNVDISYCIPHVLSYLRLGECSAAPKVSSFWNYGANLFTEYIDMRNCVPWQVLLCPVCNCALHSNFCCCVFRSGFPSAQRAG